MVGIEKANVKYQELSQNAKEISGQLQEKYDHYTRKMYLELLKHSKEERKRQLYKELTYEKECIAKYQDPLLFVESKSRLIKFDF